jgi:hypothetical protein
MPMRSFFSKIFLMGRIRKRRGLLVALVLLAAALAGCGSTAETSSTGETSTAGRIYPNVTGPTREFLIRDGDNVVQFFGREAPPAERAAASKAIHAWMRARARSAWAKDCSYFHREYVEELTKDAHSVSGGKVKNCPQALDFFGSQASGNLVNTLKGKPIVSLRMREGRGYAQYHGNDGHDWIVPVKKENEVWKVTIATPIGRSS